MNSGEEDDEDDNEHITFSLNENSNIQLDESEEGQCFNFNDSDVNNSNKYNPCLIYMIGLLIVQQPLMSVIDVTPLKHFNH